jgi:hypothetical protein
LRDHHPSNNSVDERNTEALKLTRGRRPHGRKYMPDREDKWKSWAATLSDARSTSVREQFHSVIIAMSIGCSRAMIMLILEKKGQ